MVASQDKTSRPGPPRCGDTPPFPKSKRTRKPCQQIALKGCTRCRHHGGRQQNGSRSNGKKHIKHGLYARHLTPELLAAFRAAKIDSLDDEIRLAKAKLDWAVAQWMDDPTGGIKKRESTGGPTYSESWIPWVEIVRLHQDGLMRLIECRAKHCNVEPGSKPLTTYKVWLRKRAGKHKKETK